MHGLSNSNYRNVSHTADLFTDLAREPAKQANCALLTNTHEFQGFARVPNLVKYLKGKSALRITVQWMAMRGRQACGMDSSIAKGLLSTLQAPTLIHLGI